MQGRPHSDAHGRRVIGRGFGLGIVLTLAVAAAPAQAAKTEIVGGNEGVTAPASILTTPDLAMWVADAELGLCKVQTGPQAPGTSRVVVSDYCGPEGAEDAPVIAKPTNVAQTAFDPATENFYVAEGTSKGAGVWRMHWNSATGEIDSAQRIVNTGGNRVSALALSDDGLALDFIGSDESIVRRVSSPATAAVGVQTTISGQSIDSGVLQMANLGGALYLAETGGVSRIDTPGPAAVATLLPGTADSPAALTTDPVRGLVFVGSATPRGADQVGVLLPGGGLEVYEAGFSHVTGLGRRPGALLVGEDPVIGAGGATSGQARIYEVADQPTGLPSVSFTQVPPVYGNATDVTFAYEAGPGASFECRLDGGSFEPCDASVQRTAQPGEHVFEVRPTNGQGQGRVASYAFVVDTTAPAVTVDNPASDKEITRDALDLTFSSTDYGTRFECRLDAAVWRGCGAPWRLRGLALGEHVVQVRGSDLAGNLTAPATSWSFRRSAPPAGTSGGSGGSATSNLATGSSVDTYVHSSGAPKRCQVLKAKPAMGAHRLAGRTLTVSLTPVAGARYARLTLRKRRGSGPAVVRVSTKFLKSAKKQSVRTMLSPTLLNRLRSRRYRLAVSYGACPTLFGAFAELTPTTSTKGAHR
jgi:hypothetical protein